MEQVEEKYAQLEKTIKENNPSVNLARIREAFEFARDAHGDQRRKDNSMFITHPIAAAEIIAEMGLDEDSIVAALLHDTIEDTPVEYDDIKAKFGESVATIVDGVTKLTRVKYTSREEEQMENMRKMLMAMAKDIRVILIKIGDRLHNMRTMEYQSPEKQREKAAETMEIYAPIAHRLGMQKIKWELEDLSLLYLDPVGYKAIEDGLNKRGAEHKEFFASMQERITKRLEEHGIKCTVYGRIKHIYSIYRKMYSQNKDFKEIFDLYAFRVIVDDIADCYNVLGHIHDMFKPIPGRFKDYIGTPKPNMYQSLHTTVIGNEGIPFEVQIRTWEMHHTAEYGVAAHWKYKQGVEGRTSDEEKYAWVRRLLESQQDSDAQDFIKELKIDMFADEVFVFTPRGDVINLPAGATPIDFAYSIHSAVGNRMTGAIVNGRIVPFNHELQTGDIVEVITSNSSKGPSRDWMNIVKTTEARNKIRMWFKKERREENIIAGRTAFEAEMKRAGIPLSSMTREDVLPAILKKVSFPALDDMYAAIGYGGLTAAKAVNRIRDELIRIGKAEMKAVKGKNAVRTTIPKDNTNGGVVVEGITNCLVKFSKCCTPVPGDKIRGFITRGYGVSVHRKDCQNYIKSVQNPEDAGRWVNVEWLPGTGEKYETSLTMTARERDGLVMDIAAVLAAMKLKVRSLSARDLGDSVSSVYLTIEVTGRKELSEAMGKLSTISSVISVKRVGG